MTPYDLLCSLALPSSLEIWALGNVVPGPYSVESVNQLKIPGMPNGIGKWMTPLIDPEGTLVQRQVEIVFGPLDQGFPKADIAGWALVDQTATPVLYLVTWFPSPFPLDIGGYVLLVGATGIAAKQTV